MTILWTKKWRQLFLFAMKLELVFLTQFTFKYNVFEALWLFG